MRPVNSLTRLATTWARVRPFHGQRSAFVVLAVGLVASALALFALRSYEQGRERRAFEQRADELIRALRTHLELPFETLRLMPALFDGSDPVDADEFIGFVGPALARHPGVAYFEWAPEVLDADRDDFERRARALGFRGFVIAEPGPDGRLVPAPQRPRYLPLLYVAPFSDGVVGLDLAFEPTRRDLALRALAENVLALSPQFRLIEDPPDSRAIAVYAPLVRPRHPSTDPRGPRRGLSVLIFRIAPLIEAVLGDQLEQLDLVVVDESAPPEAQLLYTSSPARTAGMSGDVGYTRAFDLHTRRWSTRFLPKPGSAPQHLTSSLVGAFGVLLSITAAFLMGALNVTRRLRNDVHAAQQIGQYRLIRKLGEGGMGVVYEAEHALLRRHTAVKVISPNAVGNDALVRFEREVKATSQLTHPNTVAVFDYGRAPRGVFYYAMEYLQGATIEQLVRAVGALPPARVVHFMQQICGSLSEAHAAGLVHRDIKPPNLMVCERGGVLDVVKVLDFGLVKDVRQLGHTASLGGTVVGTPHYMAPEIILSQGASPATDLYALGAVGYFMLTGGEVFRGETALGVCAQHVSEPPEPPSARLGRPLPAALEALILCCLDKRASARPASARALARALSGCGLPAWTEEDAAEAWRTDELTLRLQPLGEAGSDATPWGDTLVVDLEQRGLGHAEGPRADEA